MLGSVDVRGVHILPSVLSQSVLHSVLRVPRRVGLLQAPRVRLPLQTGVR